MHVCNMTYLLIDLNGIAAVYATRHGSSGDRILKCRNCYNYVRTMPTWPFPLIPAETAFRGSPSYHPISPSSIVPLTGRNRRLAGRPPKPWAWISPFLAHIKWWRYIHIRCLRRSQIISAHVSRLHSRISGWFVQFLLSLLLDSFTVWRVLTAAWQHWTLDSDSELDFDGFVTVGFGKNEHFAVDLGSGNDVD